MPFAMLANPARLTVFFTRRAGQIVYNFGYAPVAQWIERLTSDQ